MRIIETDNFGGDYPDEKFVEPLPHLTSEQAQLIADTINSATSEHHPRFWRVVPNDYKLRPGFEP